MIKRTELIKEMIEKSEEDFFKENGYKMNRQQRKLLKKKIEKVVDTKFKSFC